MSVASVVTRVRQNHAIEHATVAVLIARHGFRPLAGNALPWGFLLVVKLPVADIRSAAQEALERLQQGERDLAISPLCGTNLAVGGLLAAGAALMAHDHRRPLRSLSNAFTAATLALIVAQPVGRLVQRHLTTSADVPGLTIGDVRQLPGTSVHLVATRGNDG